MRYFLITAKNKVIKLYARSAYFLADFLITGKPIPEDRVNRLYFVYMNSIRTEVMT
jgi:hypothetical protein